MQSSFTLIGMENVIMAIAILALVVATVAAVINRFTQRRRDRLRKDRKGGSA